MRTLLLTALVLCATAVPAAAAPSITDAPALPFTDGRSVAAWADTGGLRVVRDGVPLAAAATLPAQDPLNCRLGGVNGRAAGWLCGESLPDAGYRWALELEDLTTGALSEPPGEPALRAGMTEDSEAWGFRIHALGDAAVRITTLGLHDDYTDVYRLDGGPKPRAYVSAGTVPDYDTPQGFRRVCAPAPGRTTTLLYRSPWVLSIHRNRVYLRRCGTRAARLVGSTVGTGAALTTRYAAWVTTDFRVAVRLLATGKTYTFDTTPFVTTSPRLAATAQRLWLGDRQGHAKVIDLGG
jgi:hypothetical protein